MDHSGPWPKSKRGNKYILSIVDPYSRWPISVPVPDRKAHHVVRVLLEYVISQYACPAVVVSDGAPEFIGTAVKDLCRIFGIRRSVTPAYTPSLNSPVERFHFWLNTMLTIMTSRSKSNWDDLLPMVLLNYRVSPVSGVGLSPFQMLYNRDPVMPSQLSSAWNSQVQLDNPTSAEIAGVSRTIHEIIGRAHEKYVRKVNTDDRSRPRAARYNVGDFCLIWAPKTEILPKSVPDKAKLKDQWSQPRMVVAKGPQNTYVVRDHKGTLYSVRPDCMAPYHFWLDGKPSIPSRPRYSRAERKLLNADPGAHVPQTAVVNDLVVFPLSLGEDAAFGVGRIVRVSVDGDFCLHWYGNPDDDLLGTYHPIWMTPDHVWYCATRRSTTCDEPVLTDQYYAGVINQDNIAAAGFHLTEARLPRRVLEQISDDPRYEWTLTAKRR